MNSFIEQQSKGGVRMARISKSPEERKQEIVVTALELFSKKGYENTTIQDIADYMNVATGLCYRYFKSKQEIFAATSEFYAKQAVEELQAAFPTKASVLEQFNFIIKSLFEYAIKHNEFEASYHNEPEISANRIDHLAEQVILKMTPVVKKGISEGVFNCSDVAHTLSFLTFGIVHMIHFEMPAQNPQNHIRSFIPLIKDMCCYALKVKNPETIGAGWDNL